MPPSQENTQNSANSSATFTTHIKLPEMTSDSTRLAQRNLNTNFSKQNQKENLHNFDLSPHQKKAMTTGRYSPNQSFQQPTTFRSVQQLQPTISAPVNTQKQCLFYVQTCQVNQNGKLIVSRTKEAKEKRKRKTKSSSTVSSPEKSPNDISLVSSPPKRLKQETQSTTITTTISSVLNVDSQPLPAGPLPQSIRTINSVSSPFQQQYPNISSISSITNSAISSSNLITRPQSAFILPSIGELMKSIEMNTKLDESLLLPNVLVAE